MVHSIALAEHPQSLSAPRVLGLAFWRRFRRGAPPVTGRLCADH